MSDMAHLSETSSRTRALRYAVPVFAGLLLLGACSKKDDTTNTSNTTQAGSSSGTKAPTTAGTTTGTDGTTTGTGGSKGTSVDGKNALDQTVWSQGFKIALGDITMDKTAKTVSIAASIENLGVNNASPNSTYSMEVDGAVAYTGYWKDSVTVVAGSKAKDALEFGVDDKYSAAKTTLVIGSGIGEYRTLVA